MDSAAVRLSAEAAEAIRQINRHTLGGQSLPYPGDAYSTIASLLDLALRLGQTFDQIQLAVDNLHRKGHLRTDGSGPTLDEALRSLNRGLATAGGAAATMANGLNDAHTALGPIAYQD
jgi:hypothetical protein